MDKMKIALSILTTMILASCSSETNYIEIGMSKQKIQEQMLLLNAELYFYGTPVKELDELIKRHANEDAFTWKLKDYKNGSFEGLNLYISYEKEIVKNISYYYEGMSIAENDIKKITFIEHTKTIKVKP